MTGRELKIQACLDAVHKGRNALAKVIALSLIMDEEKNKYSSSCITVNGLLYNKYKSIKR